MLVDHDSLDIHHFTFGRSPVDGDGTGDLLEALLTYGMFEASNIGIGGRYWRMETDVTLDDTGQLETYDVRRYSVFVQAAVKLN